MRGLLPWRMGWRGVTRNARTSLLLLVLTAVVVAAPFAASTLSATATFTASQVATISMGQADVQARTTSFQQGQSQSEAPQPGEAGITHVVEDRDLDLVLEGPSGTVALTGRWLPIRDPLTSGILVRHESTQKAPELALSESARDELGVGLGDEVTVGELGVGLVVTDAVSFAPDTSTPVAVIDPQAMTQSERASLLTDSGSPRWLLSTDDLTATLSYLDELELTALTPEAVSAAQEQSLLDPIVPVTVFAVVGVSLLAAGGAALAGFHRRQNDALTRLGARTVQARGVIATESVLVTLAGATLAAPLGLGISVLSRALGESIAEQVWGALEPSWWLYLGTCIAAVVLAPLLAIYSSRAPRPRPTPPRASRGARGVGAWLLGGRLARQSARGTTLGAIAVAAVVAVGAASVLVVNLVQERHAISYEAQVPEAMVGLGFSRQLTGEEERNLAAGTNTAVTEDRRAMFESATYAQPIPVVVDSPSTRCLSDPANDAAHCASTAGIFEATLAVIEPADAAGFLGRELTPDEANAIDTGDGLLLAEAEEDPRLVPMGTYQAEAAENGATDPTQEYERAIDPVPVPGYADYERSPGLLISPSALQRWNLILDAEPISYYLLTPLEELPTEQTVRAALPTDLASTADVILDEADRTTAAFTSTARTITAVSSALVFLLVVLLVLTWAADSTGTLRSLARLGMRRRALVQVLLTRGIRAILPAVIGGIGLALILIWAFSLYVRVPIPIAGSTWLIPALAATAALPVAATLRIRFGPEITPN